MSISNIKETNNVGLSVNVTNIPDIAGIKDLWAETLGDPKIRIAILDGPVDRSHYSIATGNLINLDTLVSNTLNDGPAIRHGTHIASVLLGRHNGRFFGIAPYCTYIIVPIFKDGPDNSLAPCSQLDLARAILQAIQAGAHIINISAGESSFSGTAHSLLVNAISICAAENVQVIAATGNDGCDCHNIPAVFPSVLAVGAMDSQGEPLEFSNWGESYQFEGILAPGENILGAAPCGEITINSGTSYATAIVSGIAALLLSLQLKRGLIPDPQAVRTALVSSAKGCDDLPTSDCRRLLAGRLNVKGSMSKIIDCETDLTASTEKLEITKKYTKNYAYFGVVDSHLLGVNVKDSAQNNKDINAVEDMITPTIESTAAVNKTSESTLERSNMLPSHAETPACSCANKTSTHKDTNPNRLVHTNQLVYAIGQLGYDFPTEARRDSIMQHIGQSSDIADTKQLLKYLDKNPSDASEINWILYLDQTAIYAIEVDGSFGAQIGELLRQFLREQSEEGVELISIPGKIVGIQRLFNGQVVPLVRPVLRGMYSWTIERLSKAVVGNSTGDAANKKLYMVRNFMLRTFHELRNLGLSPRERAINYSATNALNVSNVFEQAIADRMELDTIDAERSPICRPESDCWDVKLTFFDPEKVFERARRVYRFTIDVSDTVPVMIDDVRSWRVR